MTQVSEGLYANVAGSGESYVAVGEAGQHALLEKLIALRARTASGKNTLSAQTKSSPLDDLIAKLSQPVPASLRDKYGDCNGTNTTGPFHVSATSSGGLSASAYASNSNASINTTNTASAYATDAGDNPISQQSNTTHGTTTASASAGNQSRPGNACQAYANASVTCPGATAPAIVAFASSMYMANPPVACL